MTRSSSCPSRFALERFALTGEDPERSVAAHLASCGDCRMRVSELQEQGQAYMSSPVALALRRKLDLADPAAPSRRERPRTAAWFWGGGLAAAAVLLLLVTSALREPVGELPGGVHGATDGVEDLTPKGAIEFGLWVGEEGHVDAALGESPVLHPGTRVQPVFGSPRKGYLALLLTTPGGEVIRLHPASSPDAAPVEAGPLASVGPSFRLDEEVGPYRVTAYFSETGFSVADLGQSAGQDEASFPGHVLERRFEVGRE